MSSRKRPELADLPPATRKASTNSMAWVPSPRNFESPRNNLEAAHDAEQVDRHVQNLAALMADLSPIEPTPLDVDLRIESLEGMLIDVAVLVESFIGNEDATRRLLEMHGRIEQCIVLHKILQTDFSSAASAVAEEQQPHPKLVTSSGKLSRKKTKRQLKKERRDKQPLPELHHPLPQRRTSHDIVDAAFMRRKTRDHSRARSSLPAKKEAPEDVGLDVPRSSSTGSSSTSIGRRLVRMVSPGPPPPTPEEMAAAAADSELSAVMRMASPTEEEQVSLLAEVSRRLSSETDPSTDSISSEDDKHSVMEKIRGRLMDMASSQKSARRKDDSLVESRSSSSPRLLSRPPAPSSPRSVPSLELIRVKSDSVLASSVEIRARLDELLDTLRSPESSPRGSPVRRMGSPGRGVPLWSENRLRTKLASPRRLTSSSVPSSPRRSSRSTEQHIDLVTVHCRICWESTPLMLCHQIDECGDTYCLQCLRTYCNTKIDEGQVLVINCPEPTCTGELTPNDLLHLVDPPMFRRYQQFHMLATLNINPNCRWCPRPGCNTGVIANPDERKLECTTCGTEICFECKSFWHEGACEENPEDKRFAEFMKEVDAKQCPSCQNFIERIKGCNVMKCSVCGHKFCWLCLQPFTVDHFDLEGPCKGKWGVSKTEMALIYTLAGGMIVASAAVAIPSMVLGAPIYGTYRVGKWVRKGRKKEKRKKKRSRDAKTKDLGSSEKRPLGGTT